MRLSALLLLSTMLAMPVVAQDTVFRLELPSPVMFGTGSGDGDGNGGGVTQPVSLALQSFEFAPFSVGDTIEHDFADQLTVTGDDQQDVSWSIGSPSNLAAGLSGSILSGELSNIGTYDFEIVASHSDAENPARQVYTIVVNGVELKVTYITGGDNHSCALTTGGGVKCWGADSYGQ